MSLFKRKAEEKVESNNGKRKGAPMESEIVVESLRLDLWQSEKDGKISWSLSRQCPRDKEKSYRTLLKENLWEAVEAIELCARVYASKEENPDDNAFLDFADVLDEMLTNFPAVNNASEDSKTSLLSKVRS